MTGRTLQDRSWLLVTFHFGTRNQAPTLTATVRAQVTFRADEDFVVRSNIFLGEVLRNGDGLRQLAFVPVDRNGRHLLGFDVLIGAFRELQLACVTRIRYRIHSFDGGTLHARGVD